MELQISQTDLGGNANKVRMTWLKMRISQTHLDGNANNEIHLHVAGMLSYQPTNKHFLHYLWCNSHYR